MNPPETTPSRLTALDGSPIHNTFAPAGRIMCAEDDKAIRALLGVFLEMAGYEVVLVEDGAHAWELLQTTEVAALLTDLDMPRMNGLELATRVRARNRMLPMILVSGSIHLVPSPEIAALGFSEVVPKPFTRKSLVEAVSRVIQERTSTTVDTDTCRGGL